MSELFLHVALLLGAAFLAGALNAVAGGGSFLTLPALIFTGVEPVAANATGAMALLPGYILGAWAFRDDMRTIEATALWRMVAASLIGGIVGATLLLGTPNPIFRAIIPWVLLVATALFAFAPLVVGQLRRGKMAGVATTMIGILTISVYGSYFSGGLGILLLALFGLVGFSNLHTMNGLKNLLSATLTTVAVALYALGGAVQWPRALLMMLAATAGGYAGARLGRRVPALWLRACIVAVGLIMAFLFLRD
jgi:hypothetical protein